MGTRFLLTTDSTVPDAVKQIYLGTPVTDTVVTTAIDGVPHRVLRTELVDAARDGRRSPTRLPKALLQRARVPQAHRHAPGRDLRHARAWP